jgi:hypothetical protein
MPDWLKEKLRAGGADNPYAVMNAADIGKGDTKAQVKGKMSRFMKRVHRRKRERKSKGPTAGQVAEKMAILLAALLLVSPTWAQDGKRTANLVVGFDVASTTMNYPAMVGARGDPWGDSFKVLIPIDTTGSSTTVDAVTAATAPFADLAVGDLLIVRRDNSVTDMVWITAKATDDQVTVSSAVDWSAGYVFEWRDLVSGTGTDSGWISISGFKSVQMTVQYEDGDLTGLDVVWECKEASYFSEPVQVYPGPSDTCGYGTLNTNVCTYSTTGDRQSVGLPVNLFSYCRVGLAYRTADGGTREDVRIIVTGDKTGP